MNGWREIARALWGEDDAPPEGEDPRAALDAVYQQCLAAWHDARAAADEAAAARRRLERQLAQLPDEIDASGIRARLEALAARESALAQAVEQARRRAGVVRAERAQVEALSDDEAARERARTFVKELDTMWGS